MIRTDILALCFVLVTAVYQLFVGGDLINGASNEIFAISFGLVLNRERNAPNVPTLA